MLRKPLRLWPGVILAALLLVLRFVVPTVRPDLMVYGLMGSLACGPLIVLWWLFASRAPWLDRLAALALIAAGLFASKSVIDISIAGGAMGMLFPMLAIPIVSVAFVAGVAATRNLADGARRCWPPSFCSLAAPLRSSVPAASTAASNKTCTSAGPRLPKTASSPNSAASPR
jgi:hypothetical protein